MIVHLIALGVITTTELPPAEIGTIVAPAERTVSPALVPTLAAAGVNVPLGASRWASPLDPSDRLPYAIDWSRMLTTAEQVTSIEALTMSASGASVGVEIDQSEGRRPIIGEDGKAIQLWFHCLEEFQSDSAFSGAGVDLAITAKIRTNADPYQQLERTAVLTVRNQ